MALSEVRSLPTEPGHGLPPGVILSVAEWADGDWNDIESLEALKADIRDNGQRIPVCVIDGVFLDGLHRVTVLTELGASDILVCDGRDGEYLPGGILESEVRS
jgi:hypothetical protein